MYANTVYAYIESICLYNIVCIDMIEDAESSSFAFIFFSTDNYQNLYFFIVILNFRFHIIMLCIQHIID